MTRPERIFDQANVDIWERRFGEAILRTNESIVRWRRRQRELAVIQRGMDEFTAAKHSGQDMELAAAMDSYRFWQSEVARLAAQIQSAYYLRLMCNHVKSVVEAKAQTTYRCANCGGPLARAVYGKWYHSLTGYVKCTTGRPGETSVAVPEHPETETIHRCNACGLEIVEENGTWFHFGTGLTKCSWPGTASTKPQ